MGRAVAVAVSPVRDVTERTKVKSRPRRVVVTGMGIESCLGHDKDTFYNNLLEGKNGITDIQNFDCRDFPTVTSKCTSYLHSLAQPRREQAIQICRNYMFPNFTLLFEAN